MIPLIIIGYAFVEAFNPHRDVGNLLATDLHLTGSTAQIVRDTFSNAAAVGIIASFWVWIAVVMGEYRERRAGPAAVARMEELSAEISAS